MMIGRSYGALAAVSKTRVAAPSLVQGDILVQVGFDKSKGKFQFARFREEDADSAAITSKSLREEIQEFDTINVKYIDTTRQMADALTKSLSPAVHWRLISPMLGMPIPHAFKSTSSEIKLNSGDIDSDEPSSPAAKRRLDF